MGDISDRVAVRNIRQTPNQGPDYFYIGRGSPLGNPFPITQAATRDTVIRQYDAWLNMQIHERNGKVIDELDRIANHLLDGHYANLVCFCAPLPCHGDVLKRIICEAVTYA